MSMGDCTGSLGGGSDLTVVVVALMGGAALQSCLEALAQQNAGNIIVVGRSKRAAWEAKRAVPQLRLDAIIGAQTRLVAFVEDTCRPGPNWCDSVRKELNRPGVGAVSGPVTISRHLAPRYQALGLSEYGSYSPHRTGLIEGAPSRDADAVPGLAFAVARDIVLPLVRDRPMGLIEHEMTRALVSSGRSVRLSATMSVNYDAAHLEGASLRTRFGHGRLYAATRFHVRDRSRRIAYAATTPALPMLLTLRALTGSTPRSWPGLRTVLWLMLIHIAWAAGELVGYCTASAGNSLENWT